MTKAANSTVVTLISLWLMMYALYAKAMTPAGTLIMAQAEATYFDTAKDEPVTVVSNQSWFTVAPVAAMELVQDQNQLVAPGQQVSFIHRLTHTGNTADAFQISAQMLEGQPLGNLKVYEYQGALPTPDTEPLTETRPLQPGEIIELIVMGTLPVASVIGDSSKLSIAARSLLDNQILATNVDSITVGDSAIRLTKSVDKQEAKPGESLSYRISLQNTGDKPFPTRDVVVDNQPARGILLEDILPLYTEFNTDTVPAASPVQANIVVRNLDKEWISFERWDQTETITRIGLLLPQEAFRPGQSASLAFSAKVETSAQEDTLITNQAFIAEDDTGTQRLQTNEAVTKVTFDDKDIDSGRLSLAFVRPVDLLGTPSFTDVFSTANTYDLHSNNDKTKNDVFLELTGGNFRQSIKAADTLVVNLRSGTGQTVRVLLQETGVNTGLFRSQSPLRLSNHDRGDNTLCKVDDFVPGRDVADANTPDYQQPGSKCFLQSKVNDVLVAEVQDPVTLQTYTAQAGVSPQGVVFNSEQFGSLAGATVSFLDSDGNPAINPQTGRPFLSQITGTDGAFGYPRLPTGRYFIEVTPPDNYQFPSSVNLKDLTIKHVTDASYGQGGFAEEGAQSVADRLYLPGAFEVRVGQPLEGFDVPLDATAQSSALLLEKEAKQKEISPGELVSYELTVKNNSDIDLYNLEVVDSLPFGFKYMKGSSRVNGQAVDDPEGAPGPTLKFHVQTNPALAANSQLTITYALKAGAGAIDSDGINRATAYARRDITGQQEVSNEAKAQVQVKMDGVLSDKAILFGKVYVDSNCDNIQSGGEWPIGGVRLYMEDGTWAITDENGQYSLMGLNAGNHVIKVDPITMPDGLTLKPLDNRNAADGNSRFADLAPGEMHRADFAASCPTSNYEAVFAQVKARNKSINGDWLLEDAAQYNRSKPTETADSHGDLSNGAIMAPQESTQGQLAKPKASHDEAPIEVTPKPIPVIPEPENAIKTVTQTQARKGTWLWPLKQQADGRFMAVVRAGVEPSLYVNGQIVGKDRLGAQLLNNAEQAQLLAWYGVALSDGENTVEIKAKDFFGNERILAKGTFTQSSAAERIEVLPEKDTLLADGGRSLLPVKIRLLDKHGLPARGVYFVTLESSAGRWQEPDVQDQAPRHQVRIDTGEITVHLRSGDTTGPVNVRASTGELKTDTEVVQVAAPRPLVAVGIVELNAGHGSVRGSVPELDEISDGTHSDGRAALFVKGEVAKDTQLTLSYDSDKEKDTELFRDVNPDDYYPITGDASQKGYEAQSRSKLYAKVEKGRHSVMWGDYQTDTNGSDNNLARMQRSLTGVNAVYDDGTSRVQGFAARPENSHTTEIIQPDGTAMNYRLEGAPIVPNSEVLVLESMDRDNPGLIIKSQTLSRGTDYTLDEISGYLKFTRPINSKDENGNPQQIRASYDLEGDGEAYTVAGVRAEQKLSDQVTVGASYTQDDHRTDGSKLGGTWIEYKPSDKTTIALSGAHMESQPDENASTTKDLNGSAARIKVQHQWNNRSATELTWARAEEGFTNSAGGIAEGREETRLQHKQQLSQATDLRAEAEISRSLKESDSSSQGDSVGAYVDHRLGEGWKLTAGSRVIRQNSEDDKARYATALVGAEKRFSLLERDAGIKAEYEQAISNDRWRAALESDWKVHEKVSVYGRFERDEELSPVSSSDRNEFSLGVKSDWLTNTKTYSEYRMRGVTDGNNLEWVNGADSTWELTKGLSISPSVEWINTVSGDDSNDGLALSMGIQDKRYRYQRANGRVEYRNGKKNNFYGVDVAVARRLSLNWSGLVREELRLDLPKVQSESKTTNHVMTLGLARRPKLDNRQHGLYLYKWKEERGQNEADYRTVHLISTHQNRQISSDLTVSGRIGSKWVRTKLDTTPYNSQTWVTDGRMTWDLDRRWDLDIRGGVLGVDGMSSTRWSAGVGLYYLAMRNLRVGAYYNIIGFTDEDLDSEEYNAEGIHLSMQFKFDESLFDWFKS